MEVLGFQVKGKHISKQDVECGANVPHRVWLQVRRSAERSHLQCGCIFDGGHLNLLSIDRTRRAPHLPASRKFRAESDGEPTPGW